jgi:hypothetical protein
VLSSTFEAHDSVNADSQPAETSKAYQRVCAASEYAQSEDGRMVRGWDGMGWEEGAAKVKYSASRNLILRFLVAFVPWPGPCEELIVSQPPLMRELGADFTAWQTH